MTNVSARRIRAGLLLALALGVAIGVGLIRAQPRPAAGTPLDQVSLHLDAR